MILARLLPVGCLLVVVCLVCGCHREDGAGVVARVNGSPIRLADLEARHDLWRLGVPVADNPAVERLRGEFGEVLGDMIVTRLVRQELRRLHLSVTDAAVQDAEQAVRADYSPDAFDRMLLQEHVDLDRWRAALRDRLAVEIFCREVLGQNIRVGVNEAAAYYKDHIDAFTRPRRLRLARVDAPSVEEAKAALAAYRSAGSLEPRSGRPGVNVREMTLPESNVPPVWHEALRGLKAGEGTTIGAAERKGLVLILLARESQTVLDPSTAYGRVSALLHEDKLAKAFAAWVTEALATADIRVDRRLLAREDAVSRPGEAPAAATTSAPTPSGKSAVATPDSPSTQDRPAPAVPSPSPGPADSVASTADDSHAGPTTAPVPEALTPPPAQPAPQENVAVRAEQTVTTQAPQPVNEAEGSQPAGKDVQEKPAFAATAPTDPSPEISRETPGTGEVSLTAAKASWVLYAVDGGDEARVYLKPDKPLVVAFRQKLVVRLGSPSEVRYRYAGQEHVVTVGKKERRVLEFP